MNTTYLPRLPALALPSLALSAFLALWAPAVLADDGHRHASPVEGLSGLHHPITTDSEEAQRFFDQGLELAYGFNHTAAADAFREAVRLDPDCAMCHWGVALVLGPNINAAMDPADNPEAFASVQRARRLAAQGPTRERDTIDALAQRYAAEPPEDRASLDKAYADAMRRVYTKYPEDLDLATLFAESLMDTTPWDYWTEDNQPRRVTEEFLAVLETVLRREPGHTGANHYLIHAVEKVRPDLGLPAAARLEMLAEGAGHLVHMGSHIYLRVGQYHDASRVNVKAMEADERFRRAHGSSATYDMYRWHNPHFLVASTSFEGRSELALETAFDLRDAMDEERMRTPGFLTMQHFWATPYFTLVRFGQWRKILEEPQPAADLVYPSALWRFARGMAQLRLERPEEAAAELAELETLAQSPVLDEVTIWDLNTSRQIVDIARLVLRGELAAAAGDLEAAEAALAKGVALEDALNYDEPPPWQFPVRQNLGAVLLESGQAEKAEAVYRADLEAYPWNGWSLRGLALSLAEQGRDGEAQETAEHFERAWQHADVAIEGSRF